MQYTTYLLFLTLNAAKTSSIPAENKSSQQRRPFFWSLPQLWPNFSLWKILLTPLSIAYLTTLYLLSSSCGPVAFNTYLTPLATLRQVLLIDRVSCLVCRASSRPTSSLERTIPRGSRAKCST